MTRNVQKKFSRTRQALMVGAMVTFVAMQAPTTTMAAGDDHKTVVIFVSAGNIQVGFAGENAPRVSMKAIVGKSKSSNPMMMMNRGSQLYFGDDALKRKATLTLSYPVTNSVVTNMKDFEKLIHHILYKKLRIAPEDIGIAMNETSTNPKPTREKLTQMFFETFNVKKFYISKNFTNWLMTSQITARSTFQEMFVTKDEYDEVGAAIIHRKAR